MDSAIKPSEALPLLARLYRERRSGLVSLGPAEPPLRVFLRDGQVVGLGPLAPPQPAPRPPLPRPDDSARFRLERVLEEIGIRPHRKPAPRPAGPAASDLRGRLLEALADPSLPATFEEGGDPPPDVVETVGATEALILEAVRRLRDAEAVRTALGDTDQCLVATASLGDERTLTLTEGYLLSRIDGRSSARQVLRLAPLDPDETERALLGLLLTGRLEYGAAPAPSLVPRPEPEAPSPTDDVAEPVAQPAGASSEPEPDTSTEEFPQAYLIETDETSLPRDATVRPAPAKLGAEILDLRKDIIEAFQSLPGKNHFEVLGVEPGCSDADVKRAHAALVRRYHPDVHRDPRTEDLHDILVKIFISVGEAWEVLGDARSRASYEARLGVVRRPPGTAPPRRPTTPESGPRPPQPPPPPAPDYVPPEDTLFKARLLLSQARYWDTIHLLESTVPQMEERRHQHKGRILLAKAYAQNPNWVRRAEETLQNVVRENPASVDAHYELGLLYKAGGLAARAQAMFRHVLELRPDHREAAAELGPGEGPVGGSLLKRLFGRGKAS